LHQLLVFFMFSYKNAICRSAAIASHLLKKKLPQFSIVRYLKLWSQFQHGWATILIFNPKMEIAKSWTPVASLHCRAIPDVQPVGSGMKRSIAPIMAVPRLGWLCDIKALFGTTPIHQ
jgi:hypothetical protein